MKKKINVLISAALLIVFIIPVLTYAKEFKDNYVRSLNILINNNYIISEVEPFIENNRTYVPIRLITSELGYSVNWNALDKSVTVSKDNQKMVFKVNSDECTVNGENQHFDGKVLIRKNRTFIPLRFMAQTLGEKVDYNNESKTVVINSDYNIENYYKVKFYKGNNPPEYINGELNSYYGILSLKDKLKFHLKEMSDLSDDNVYEVFKNLDINEEEYDSTYEFPLKIFTLAMINEKRDFLSGEWHGKMIFDDDPNAYDSIVYIEKVDVLKYNVTTYVSKRNGSYVVFNQTGLYNPEENILNVSESYDTVEAVGDFDYSYYLYDAYYNIKGKDTMVFYNNDKMVLKKYK